MIPPKLREEMANDPEYQVCARSNGDCRGRITWEHAWLWQGRKLQERFSIIPLCARHHLGDLLDKKWNQDYALTRATQEDRIKYKKLSKVWPSFS